jgi:P-type Mg2+ transporter
MNQVKTEFWSIPASDLLQQLQTTAQGLSSKDAHKRLELYGSNLLKAKKRTDSLTLFLNQFKSPIIIILLFAAGLSFFLHDAADALIISLIVLVSGLLGFFQERGANNAVEKLLAIVQTKVQALRDRKQQEVPLEEIIPGDIVILTAGDLVPGDCALVDSRDLFLDEATLTGETYPVEKEPCLLPPETPLSQRKNTLFMGTHVVSGIGTAVVVFTGTKTEFGKVSERLKLRPAETEFEVGVRRFGYFLMEVTLVLLLAIFAINVYLARPVMESFLFSLALAVGMTPQLLPAIITINLSHGAKRMAAKKVIVKRLAAIENFGSMNVLCSDKTGTLTEGQVHIQSAVDVNGQHSEKALFYAYLNASYETGFINPIDQAIRTHRQFDITGYKKLDEVPYDFIRKRLSILVTKDDSPLLITKGALPNVLSVCSSAEISDGNIIPIALVQEQVQQHFVDLSNKGFRILGVAYRHMGTETVINKDHETGMVFLGLLVLFDPPKTGVADTISHLKTLGVSLKIITGDNRLVAANIAQQVGLSNPHILTGQEIRLMSTEALLNQVNAIEIFTEVEPNQKEKIILALRKAGNVVGFMGDGINDASALHAADVGISVDDAVDVAKEAADIVLLEKDLGVLINGVREGRVTFSNTLKYVFMATSANFGNMFSMAGASLFLPFLPLLPKQVLLTNLMTDFPEMTIATDNVDQEMIEKPRRWDLKFIRNFMLTFGIISSVFDYLTFGALLFILHASTEQFRTGWFLESVVSATLIVLVIRTRKPFFKSLPGKALLVATIIVIGVTLIAPLTPFGGIFEFIPMPASFLLVLIIILVLYILSAERAKKLFYKRI